jgi:hypothetical protein
VREGHALILVGALLVFLQVGGIALSFTLPKDRRVAWGFHVPSVVIAWLAYAAYEMVYIPRYCPGDCNIRVDLLLIYPYLVLVTAAAAIYFKTIAGARGRQG